MNTSFAVYGGGREVFSAKGHNPYPPTPFPVGERGVFLLVIDVGKVRHAMSVADVGAKMVCVW
jgi:hypothetical protein